MMNNKRNAIEVTCYSKHLGELLLLGKLFKVKAVNGYVQSIIDESNNVLHVPATSDNELIVKLKDFLKSYLKTLLKDILEEFGSKVRAKPKAVRIMAMKRKWGSCSRNKTLIINLATIALPPHLIKYIVAHEITHLITRRHSKTFWSIVKALCGEIDLSSLEEFEKQVYENNLWREILGLKQSK